MITYRNMRVYRSLFMSPFTLCLVIFLISANVNSNDVFDFVDTRAAEGCDVVLMSAGDAGTSEKIGNLDAERFPSKLALLQEKSSRVVSTVTVWQMAFLSKLKCPWIALNTSDESRFKQLVHFISMETRVTMTLVVVSASPDMKEALTKAAPKPVFDAYFISQNTSGKFEMTEFLVGENPAWNQVRVAFRFMPYSILPKGRGKYQGIDVDIMKEATRRTRVKFKLHKAKTYATMIEELKNGTADMAIGSASYSHHRYQTAGDVSAAYSYWNVYLLTRIPQEIAADWTLIHPFDWISWFLLSLSLVAMFVFLIVMRKQLLGRFNLMKLHIFGISFVALISEAVPTEWFDVRKHSRSGLILLFMWMPAALFISFAYKSTLLASLVSVEREKPISTWRQLIDSGMQLQIPTGIILNDIMRTSPIPVVRCHDCKGSCVVSRDQARSFVKTAMPAVISSWTKSAKGGRSATFHCREAYQTCVKERNGNYRVRTPELIQARLDNRAGSLGSLRGGSVIYMKGEHLTSAPLGVHFIRKFPWKGVMDQTIQDFYETGLIAKQSGWLDFKYAKDERDFKRSEKVDKGKKLSSTHLQLTWWLLGISLIVSVLSFVWEKVNFWIFGDTYVQGGGGGKEEDSGGCAVISSKLIKTILKASTKVTSTQKPIYVVAIVAAFNFIHHNYEIRKVKISIKK